MCLKVDTTLKKTHTHLLGVNRSKPENDNNGDGQNHPAMGFFLEDFSVGDSRNGRPIVDKWKTKDLRVVGCKLMDDQHIRFPPLQGCVGGHQELSMQLKP